MPDDGGDEGLSMAQYMTSIDNKRPCRPFPGRQGLLACVAFVLVGPSFDGEAVLLGERADVVGCPAGELLNDIEMHVAFKHIEHNIPLAFGFASF